MYKSILLSVSLIFCCNCYSYNEISNKTFVVGKHYKITNKDRQILKTKILAEKGDSLLISGYKRATTLSKEKITKLEERKFSTAKTVGWPSLIIGILIGLSFYSLR